MVSLKVALLICSVSLISCQSISTEAEDQENSSTEKTLLTSHYTETSEGIGDVNITEEINEQSTEEENATTTYYSTDSTETTAELLGNVTTEETTVWSSCSQKPCKNGGTCQEDSASGSMIYNCSCQEGFTGKLCEIKDDCFSNDKGDVCFNGVCVYNHLATRMCECPLDTSWDDQLKECREPELPCFPNPCLNKGTCKAFKDGTYKCECASGFEGSNCDVVNKCGDEDFCGNGTCILNDSSNFKFCKCENGFYFDETSRQCEEMELPCIPNPCHNNGVCEVASAEKYNCSCLGQYIDANCEVPHPCYSTENGLLCGGHGECSETSQCNCAEGYYLDHEAHTCRESKEPCFPNPCHGHGICLPLDSKNYNCTCSEGFTGEQCSESDLCVLQGGNTKCGDASCISSSSEGIFYCRCEKGHFFDYGKKTCERIDYCPLMKCKENEDCINSQCACKEHYKWNNDTMRCEANICESNPCLINEMECSEGKDYHCFCKEGFSFIGDRCVEAFCTFPDLNVCEQKCQVDEGEILCSCHEEDQFKLNDDNRTCTYEGNSTCLNKTCEKGSCVKEDGVETCLCPPGFIEIEGNCLDLCSAKRLDDGYCPNNICEPTKTGFRCICGGKYKYSKDNVTCETRQFCIEDEIGWELCSRNNAECIEDWNSDKGFRCQCIFPQVMASDGTCQDVCNIEDNQRQCSNLGAKCDINKKGEKICKCPPLYQNTEETEYCNKPAEFSYLLTIPFDLDSYTMKHSNDVRTKRSMELDSTANYFQMKIDIEESMSKLFPELAFVNIINCRNNNNFFICKVELQFESDVEEGLQRINSTEICILAENTSFDTCLIPPSLILNKDHLKNYLNIKRSDPCEDEFKEILCGSETVCVNSNGKNSFNCTCKQGFVARDRKFLFAESDSVVESCNDVDECLDINACPLFTTCHNTIGSYTCSCIPGYRMRNKSSDPKVFGCVEICDPNPCDHGTCEEKGDHDFECRCEEGFAGALCDLSDSNFKRARTNTIIVGAVLGGALLVLIIMYITTVSRLKKKKSLEEHDRFATEMTERRAGGAVNNAFQRE